MAITFTGIVKQANTFRFTATIVDETGAVLPAASLATLTLTLYDLASFTIINSRNAQNVLNGGGSGNSNTSLWLIGWGPRSIYLVTVDGQPLTIGGAEVGLVVADWRHAIRIANINPTENKEKIEALLLQATTMLPANWGDTSEQYRATIYVAPAIKKILGVDNCRGVFIRDIGLRLDEAPVLGKQERAA